MSRVWICLSLLCAATHFLQSNASSDGVMVTCNETVEVEAGRSLTVYCSVRYNNLSGCKILSAYLNNNSSVTPEIKGNTSVLLNVPNVMKDNNWTVEVNTDCGLAKPFPIKVKVTYYFPPTDPKKSVKHSDWHTTAPIIFCVCLFLTAGILCLLFLFGTDRGRKIIKLVREKIHGGYTNPDSSLSPDKC